jgi:exodeoxyribonuclease VIII
MMPLLMPKKMDEKLIRDVIAANGGKGFAMKGIPNDEYHAGPGISSTDIKDLVSGTVESWLYNKKNGRKQSAAMWLGTAIHTMVLEPDQFWERYCLEKDYPRAPARNTKEGKTEYENWCDSEMMGAEVKLTSEEWQSAYVKFKYPDLKKEIIGPEDLATCEGIAASIDRHPMIRKMFADGDSEVTLYWLYRESPEDEGILCKARPDRLNQTFPCIPDLKSTTDAGLDSFEGDITDHLWHVSAWWYLWGAKECFGFDFQDFVYVPCEKKPPYQVTFYTADEGSLQVGEGLARAGLAIYRKYLFQVQKVEDQEQQWFGHSLEPKSAGIRPWAFNKLSQVIHSHDLQGMGLEKFVGNV